MWRNASQYKAGGSPESYIAIKWDSEHEKILNAVIGDPAHQATFEAYTILEAVSCWVNAQTRGRIVVLGDAEGILGSLSRLSAKSRIINEIAKELALHLGPLGHSLAGIHIWGEENILADALSRLCKGVALPKELANVPRFFPQGPSKWRSLGKEFRDSHTHRDVCDRGG